MSCFFFHALCANAVSPLFSALTALPITLFDDVVNSQLLSCYFSKTTTVAHRGTTSLFVPLGVYLSLRPQDFSAPYRENATNYCFSLWYQMDAYGHTQDLFVDHYFQQSYFSPSCTPEGCGNPTTARFMEASAWEQIGKKASALSFHLSCFQLAHSKKHRARYQP